MFQRTRYNTFLCSASHDIVLEKVHIQWSCNVLAVETVLCAFLKNIVVAHFHAHNLVFFKTVLFDVSCSCG